VGSEPYPIVIVGCGPGSPEYLTAAAIRAVQEAEVLVGARRLLELFPAHPGERFLMEAHTEKVLAAIAERPDKKIAVLVTGDPGLASLARPILKRFGRGRCRVIPGVSSLQVAFARLGLDWLGVRVINAHGKDPSLHLKTLEDIDKIAVLGGRKESLSWLLQETSVMNEEFNLWACEDLTLETERIRELNPRTAAGLELSSRTIFILVRKKKLSTEYRPKEIPDGG
jgi:precorrin-6y C5,15-methyltransferase (decarboxylating) CbiE subunit